MFTGIVETIGVIKSIVEHDQIKTLVIAPQKSLDDLKVDDSIAINGICLTVVACDAQQFTVQAVPETLRKTNLGQLQISSQVNLERSMLPTTRMGGHFVQGHVDGVGVIAKIENEGEAKLLTVIPAKAGIQENANLAVDKGYITVDGMSLTIIKADEHGFSLTLIPHTQAVTIAKHYQVEDRVNIEFDVLGKYIQKTIHNNVTA